MDYLAPDQCVAMAAATTVGRRFGVRELPALILTESSAGRHIIGDDGHSLGWAQMTVNTALEVLTTHPKLWPGKHSRRDIRTRLLNDPLWAMTLAAQRLLDLRTKTKHPLRAYNAGEAGAARGAGAAYEQLVLTRKWTCRYDPRHHAR